MIDWEEIKNEYLAQSVTLRELAERHGLTYSALRKRCTAENWSAQRSELAEGDGKKLVEHVSMKLLKKLEKAIDQDGDTKDIKAMAGALKELRDIRQRDEPDREEGALEVCFLGDSGELSR